MVLCSEASNGFMSQSKAEPLPMADRAPCHLLCVPLLLWSTLPPLLLYARTFLVNVPSVISPQGLYTFCAVCLDHFSHVLVPWSLLILCSNVTFARGLPQPPYLVLQHPSMYLLFSFFALSFFIALTAFWYCINLLTCFYCVSFHTCFGRTDIFVSCYFFTNVSIASRMVPGTS